MHENCVLNNFPREFRNKPKNPVLDEEIKTKRKKKKKIRGFNTENAIFRETRKPKNLCEHF